jgi:hypothetical protein
MPLTVRPIAVQLTSSSDSKPGSKSGITNQYSGIVVNQNQIPTGSVTDSLWYYQEFFLPANFARGTTDDEKIIPALSGFQSLVSVIDDDVSLIWKLEYDAIGTGWIQLTSGTTSGAPAKSENVWMDSFFDTPIDVSEVASNRFRIGFQSISGISKLWYTTPNPFALQFAKAYHSDGTTVLQNNGNDVAFSFRLLAMTADNGIDFLGNSFRSAVTPSALNDISRLNGNPYSGWMSAPLPSRFAVANLYFDVRGPTPLQYQLNPDYIGPITNFVTNPSFEVSTANWTTSNGTAPSTGATLTQDATTSQFGAKSGKVVTTAALAGEGIGIDPVPSPAGGWIAGTKYTFSVYLKGNAGGEQVLIWFGWDGGSDKSPQQLITLTNNWVRYAVEWTPISTRTTALIAIMTQSAQALTFFVDGAMVVSSAINSNPAYFDGNSVNSIWNGTTGLSSSTRGAIGDTYISVEPSISDEVSVIDKLLLDPITPGVYFNVYWSNEGEPGMTDAEWDDKLWTHIPRTYRALKRESHVFPEPVLAKYIKVEFSHLQAQSYNPGDLARPVSYSKHPKWILDYFLARTEAQNKGDNRLLANTVSVIYDALDLAYNYYLDDLGQEPDKPIEIDPSYESNVTQFLQNRGDASDQADPTTLSKINLSLAPYREHPSVFAKDDYLLGQYARQAASLTPDYPVEMDPSLIDSPDVRVLRNEAVVFESDYPVMFFYLTCRHKYREVIAEFSHNRAYFAGVREIAFTRENYTIANDANQYQEPAGDLTNTERNDFVRIDGVMTV